MKLTLLVVNRRFGFLSSEELDRFAEKSQLLARPVSSSPRSIVNFSSRTVSTKQRCSPAAPGHEKSLIKTRNIPSLNKSASTVEGKLVKGEILPRSNESQKKAANVLTCRCHGAAGGGGHVHPSHCQGSAGQTARDGGVGVKSEVAIRYHFRLGLVRLKAVKSAASYYFRQKL